MSKDSIDEKQFTGLSKYFNSWTPTGRANTSKATIGTIVFGYIAYKIYKKFIKTEPSTSGVTNDTKETKTVSSNDITDQTKIITDITDQTTNKGKITLDENQNYEESRGNINDEQTSLFDESKKQNHEKNIYSDNDTSRPIDDIKINSENKIFYSYAELKQMYEDIKNSK